MELESPFPGNTCSSPHNSIYTIFFLILNYHFTAPRKKIQRASDLLQLTIWKLLLNAQKLSNTEGNTEGNQIALDFYRVSPSTGFFIPSKSLLLPLLFLAKICSRHSCHLSLYQNSLRSLKNSGFSPP